MKRLCSVEGCERIGRGGFGYCTMHYKRFVRHGDVQVDVAPGAGRLRPHANRSLTPLGENIQARRLAKGLSVKQLADMAGVNVRTVCRMTGGHDVSLAPVRAVAAALGCADWELLKP